MKTNQIFTLLTIPSLLLFAPISHAADIIATNSGNWGDTNVWLGGIVPGTNDDAAIEDGINVTVDTNASVQYIYDNTLGGTGGTVTMAPNSTLNVLGDPGTDGLTLLDATASGNTVIYFANPFFAKECNYYNLVFCNTNYPGPLPWQDFNNFSRHGPTPMTIAGDVTLLGKVQVQQGADITIGGNLFINKNCRWDCSVANLTVTSNTVMGGLLFDGDGADGTNYFGGNITVTATSLEWYISDVTQWFLGGSLTNNGLIGGTGYGSISFNGTGIITGSKAIKIPTMTVNGTYTIGTTITLTTNTPTLNGTLMFNLANTNQIVLLTNAGTALYYSGILNVINSGAPPASGASYQLFNAPSYGGSFAAASFPGLPNGLSWVDNTLSTGSIDVTGASVGSPILALSRNGGLLTLSWDSSTFPGYSVQAQTNRAGIGSNWSGTGSGTVSPFIIGLNPTNPLVFFRLSNP